MKDGAGAVIASYTYDGDGQRLTKTANGETITYHYFGGQLMYETSSLYAGKFTARYNRTPAGKLLSIYIYRPAGNYYNYYYYHYNAHGDVVALTDTLGNVYRQYSYDPYGNVISVKDGAGNSVNMSTDDFNHAYTYAGYRYDKETGLYFLNSRYYVAGIGRFLTKDKVLGNDSDPKSLNRYVYAEGDPINNTDPTGTSILASLGALLLAPEVGLIAVGVVIVIGLYVTYKVGSYLYDSFTRGASNLSQLQSGDTVSEDTDYPTVNGPPNGNVTLHNPETGRTQRRYYDKNGKAKKDIDLNHGNDEPFPHVHDWEPIIGTDKVRRIAGPGRTNLTSEELDSIKDIKHLINPRYRQLPF